jgi:hypothetical protein
MLLKMYAILLIFNLFVAAVSPDIGRVYVYSPDLHNTAVLSQDDSKCDVEEPASDKQSSEEDNSIWLDILETEAKYSQEPSTCIILIACLTNNCFSYFDSMLSFTGDNVTPPPEE